MDAPITGHLVLEQSVDQPVTRGLHLALEPLRGDVDAEMGFARGAPRHGFVVSVFVRIIEDLEAGWGESGCYLDSFG